MEGFLLRFREESINEETGWKVRVEGGGWRACMSVFARRSGEVCAEGGVREGERRTWKEGVCVKSYMCLLLGLVHMEMSPFNAALHIPAH